MAATAFTSQSLPSTRRVTIMEAMGDVIAFPKVKDASCLMTKAPTPVDPKQLEDLGIEVIPEEKEE